MQKKLLSAAVVIGALRVKHFRRLTALHYSLPQNLEFPSTWTSIQADRTPHIVVG